MDPKRKQEKRPNDRQHEARATSAVSAEPVNRATNQFRLYAVLLGLFAFILYSNTIHNDFLLDDTNLITGNEFVKKGWGGIPSILTTEYRAGYWVSQGNLYRPLPMAVFAVLWEYSPGKPELFHIINCLVFALTAALLFLLLCRLMKQEAPFIPLLITTLFVVHPVHTEVVANIKSLDELLALFFSLGCCHLVLSYAGTQKAQFLAALALLYFLALASKEGAITFVFIFPLLLGGVVFVNAQTFSEWPGNKYEVILPGYGLGLRIQVNKYSRTNLALDYGFGVGQSRGFFVNLCEMF